MLLPITGFPQALEIMENLENHQKKGPLEFEKTPE